MTRQIDRPENVLADAKHLRSSAGVNARVVAFRHQASPDGQGRFTYFDDSLITLCGLQPALVIADAAVLYAAVFPDDLPRFEQALEFDDGENANHWFEVRFHVGDGEPRWFHGQCWPPRLADGMAVSDGILVDITDRKRKQARDMSIVEAMPIPAAITRVRDGHIFYANDLYCAVLGMKESDLERSAAVNFVDAADREKMLEELHEHGLHLGFELRVKKADGTVMLALVSARLMEFDGEEAIFGSLFDITDTKATEQKIKVSERRLQDFAEAASDWFWETDAEHRYTALYMGGRLSRR